MNVLGFLSLQVCVIVFLKGIREAVSDKQSGRRPLPGNTAVTTAELSPRQNKHLTKSPGGNVEHLSSWMVYRRKDVSDLISGSTVRVLTTEFRA